MNSKDVIIAALLQTRCVIRHSISQLKTQTNAERETKIMYTADPVVAVTRVRFVTGCIAFSRRRAGGGQGGGEGAGGG